MELFLAFLEPHRLRYVTSDNSLVHDDYVEVRYEFTTTEGSHRFQGDLRAQDLVDHFDIDVIWSDRDNRTDSFGSVRGIGAIQRMKLWRDRYSACHNFTMYANRTDRRYHDYFVSAFDSEIKIRDDSHRRLRLNVRGRRGSARDSGSSNNKGDGHSSRRFSMSSLRHRPRASTSGRHHSLHASSSRSSRSSQSHSEQTSAVSPSSSASFFSPGDTLAIRYLGIQFSRNEEATLATMKVVLSVNAGSSSVKISVYVVEAPGGTPHELAEAQISGLTAPPPRIDYRRGDKVVHKNALAADVDSSTKISSQADAFKLLLNLFVNDNALAEIGHRGSIALVTHRIVHGGDFSEPQIVGKGTYAALEKLNDLAPLHNAKSLEIINACLDELPHAINMACFDSQFHSTIPLHIRTYPIDQTIAKKNMLRKYGFHGLSYSFITRAVATFLGKPAGETNLIALHLGSGASACAVQGGRSWDTSMGLTPLAGLPGATRSGSVDPSLVFHYASDVGRLAPASTSHLHITQAEEILNKESGWKALTGTTNFAEIAASDEPSHSLAFNLFVDRVCGFVGSYYVTLGGKVDALVFAGGIGERSDRLRAAVVSQCSCLGFSVDPTANVQRVTGSVTDITSKDAAHRVLVCQTDEQLEMARSGAESKALWQ
ncbi:acetate kinase [Grosmannia clavigera kw1407]|uniref:Probable acetate kinase n=1 Tax=Grosmannia clavigera (strain kw1407 / UAMH 11150) TaxID=655863 RepID=F0XC80_GROCL|nr:acetate kinase [Grosmannia clavigera kw1407]EFX03853.1 acetate kinase [Grosmannia clavigera kw1407]